MSRTSRADWLVPAGLILLSLVPAFFGSLRLIEIAQEAPVTATNARFLADPVPMVLHLVAVIPFSIVGAFQFSRGIRRRRRGWHRAAGMVLAPLGLVAALTGLWMTLAYPWPAGDGAILYYTRLVVGVAMTAAIILAVLALRRRDYTTHGEWMIRGYAIGLGAGTQVLTHLPWFIIMGKPGELPRAVLMAAGWGINIAVAEWVIWRQRRVRRVPVGVVGAGAGARALVDVGVQ